MRKNISQLFVLVLFVSCANVIKNSPNALKFRDHIYKGECKEAQDRIPLEKSETGLLRFYQGSLGYLASTSMVPITLTLDMILLGRCQYGGCKMPEDGTIHGQLFPSTTWTYEATKNIRCPDTSYYVQKFLEIAECYEKKEDIFSLNQSLAILGELKKNYEDYFTCIQSRDGILIESAHKRVTGKMKSLSEAGLKALK